MLHLLKRYSSYHGLAELLLVLLILIAGAVARVRVASGWTFTGSDGYIYMGAAMELGEHGRYAIRLPPWHHVTGTPAPNYTRPPGYPLLLAAVARPFPATYEQIAERAKRMQRVLDLATALCAYALARGLAGRRAGLITLALAALDPFQWLYAAAMLSETLAMALTTFALALLAVAVAPRARHGALAWAGSGALIAALMLVRADGVLLLPCLGLPLLTRREPLRRRLLGTTLAVLVTAVVFAPWPLRNVRVFGAAYPFGSPTDNRAQPLRGLAVLRWAATWITRESELPSTLWCIHKVGCAPSVATYPASAFASEAEKKRVAALFLRYQREGLSPAVDQEFAALAAERVRAAPLRNLLWLPAQRAFFLWGNVNDLPLRSTDHLPWPRVFSWLRYGLLGFLLMAEGGAVLGGIWLWRRERAAALLLLGAVALRTGFLALAGYVEGRYVLELLPVLLVLEGVALAAWRRSR